MQVAYLVFQFMWIVRWPSMRPPFLGRTPECYDAELSSYILKDPNPFGFNNLTYIKEVNRSKALNSSKNPCVIISASGMANAGRVKHHIFNNVENPRTTILIVGFCAPGTLGRLLRDGIDEIRMYGVKKKIKSGSENHGFLFCTWRPQRNA